MESDGFIKVQITNNNDEIIEGYTYDDFIELDKFNSDDYILKWNNKNNIFNQNIYVNIKFYKAKLYTINGQFI